MELYHSGVCCDKARVEEILHPDFCEEGRSGVMYERSKVVKLKLTSNPNEMASPKGCPFISHVFSCANQH